MLTPCCTHKALPAGIKLPGAASQQGCLLAGTRGRAYLAHTFISLHDQQRHAADDVRKVEDVEEYKDLQ